MLHRYKVTIKMVVSVETENEEIAKEIVRANPPHVFMNTKFKHNGNSYAAIVSTNDSCRIQQVDEVGI